MATSLKLPPNRRPLTIHVFHGHVLVGYFDAATTRVFLTIERLLARRTDRIVAVSDEISRELWELGVRPRDPIVVLPVGLDLDAFADQGSESTRIERGVCWASKRTSSS